MLSCKTKQPIIEAHYESKTENRTEPQPALTDAQVKQKMMRDAFFLDAMKMLMIERYDKAQEMFIQLTILDPSFDAAYFQIARLKAMQQQYSNAVIFAERAVILQPENKWYLETLAALYRQVRKYEKSAQIYEKLAKMYPEEMDYAMEWANSFLFAGQPQKALKVYDWIENEIGLSEPISLQKYKIYLAMRQSDNAYKTIEKLSDKYPGEIKYIALLAELNMDKKNYEKAEALYKKIIDVAPDDPYVHISLADLYRKQKKTDKYYDELNKGIANKNFEFKSKLELFSVLYENVQDKDIDTAQLLKLFHTLVQTHPNEALAHSLLGDFYQHFNSPKAAKEQYLLALSIDSSTYNVWSNLLYMAYTEGDSVILVKYGAKAVEMFPEQPVMYYFTAIGYLYMEKWSENVDYLERGLPLIVDNMELKIEFMASLANGYEQLKQYGKADSMFREVLKLNPDHLSSLNNFAYFLALRKTNLDEAQAMIEEAFSKDPTNIYYIDTYAWVLFQQGKYQQALDLMNTLMQNSSSESADAWDHYGDILWKTGYMQKAIEAWNKAMEICKEKCSDNLKNKIEKKMYIENN